MIHDPGYSQASLVHAGRLAYTRPMLSIKDIARLAGVSPATVSRVINEREYVKEDIRTRVLSIVKEKGYVPNHAARSMVLKRSFNVGILIPDTFNMFQRQLFSIIERHLESRGFHTLFFFVKWDTESEIACLKRIKAQKLDGLIMMHEVRYPAFYDYIADSPMPVILLTFERKENAFVAVHVDEEGAASAATGHLVELGHRHIGIIAGAHFSFSDQRVNGCIRTLQAAGIQPDERDLVRVPSYNPEAGKIGMERLLQAGRKPTAIFAVTDELAIGAIRTLYENGLRVPEDMSVIGIDDIDISGYMAPGLSTVRQPILDMGHKTAETMSALIEEGIFKDSRTPAAYGQPFIFPYELVIRESTARLAT